VTEGEKIELDNFFFYSLLPSFAFYISDDDDGGDGGANVRLCHKHIPFRDNLQAEFHILPWCALCRVPAFLP
jgi:hypothetical protein